MAKKLKRGISKGGRRMLNSPAKDSRKAMVNRLEIAQKMREKLEVKVGDYQEAIDHFNPVMPNWSVEEYYDRQALVEDAEREEYPEVDDDEMYLGTYTGECQTCPNCSCPGME